MLLTLFFNSIDPIRLFNRVRNDRYNLQLYIPLFISLTSVLSLQLLVIMQNYLPMETIIFISSFDNLEDNNYYVSYDGLITHDERFCR